MFGNGSYLLGGTSLDLLARVSVLEGIANVKPGTWMRTPIPTRAIVEAFGGSSVMSLTSDFPRREPA